MLSILFLLTGILGIAGLFNFIQSKFKERNFGPFSILVFSMALTPPIYSFILWLCMLLIPYKISPSWYVSTLFSGNIVLCILFIKQISEWGKDLLKGFNYFFDKKGIRSGCRICLLGCFIAGWLILLLLSYYNKILSFDMTEYALCGDYFAQAGKIVYRGPVINPQNGFMFLCFHSFIFPLFGTLSVFFEQTMNLSSDFYFKYVFYHYFITLNLCCLFYLCGKMKTVKQFWIVFSCLTIINFSPTTLDFLYSFGIDFFRVTLLMLFIWVLNEYIMEPNKSKIFFLILLGSFAMLAHGMQVFFVLFLSAAVLFADCNLRQKLQNTMIIGIGYLVLGLSHYIIATFWGDGWLIAPLFDNQTAGGVYVTGSPQYSGIFPFGMYGLSYLFVIFLPVAIFLNLRSAKNSPKKSETILLILVCILQILLFIRFSYNFRYLYTFFPLAVLVFFAYFLSIKIYVKHRCIWLILLIFILLSPKVNHTNINRAISAIPLPRHTNMNRQNFFDKIGSGNVVFIAKNKGCYRWSSKPMAYCGADHFKAYVILPDGTRYYVENENLSKDFLTVFDYVIIVEQHTLSDKLDFIINAVHKNGTLITEDGNLILFSIKNNQGEKDDK